MNIVEEPHSRRMIQGRSTSTAGFVGPTHQGPVTVPTDPITSLHEFEQHYGGSDPIRFENATPIQNFLWHAARAFFENGGKRLFISRVHSHGSNPNSAGLRPTPADYAGSFDAVQNSKTGLMAFEEIEEISIVAAPGSTFASEGDAADATAIAKLLIAHAELMRYRIAVMDSPNGQTPEDVEAFRANFDSRFAALYYPWVKIQDPATGMDLALPPSGFVAGIYARTDDSRGVFKAPANEEINLAIGLETLLDNAQQETLNPIGINALRFFPGRGFRVWGARTISSDPEWKYVNLRRYFAYLEHSIDRGTQWAVFEPNRPSLWRDASQSVSDFLYREWRNGALQGAKPSEAFFVKCDRTTMTQDDIDNGRMIILIGVAVVRPAEFVIFRIGQWTADHKP